MLPLKNTFLVIPETAYQMEPITTVRRMAPTKVTRVTVTIQGSEIRG
jgi:hypothetical protein